MKPTTPRPPARPPGALDRRRFLAGLGAAGVAGSVLPAVLAAEGTAIDAEGLACAERLLGFAMTPEERELMLEDVAETVASFEELRSLSIPNHVRPAVTFSPLLPGEEPSPSPVGEPRPLALEPPPGGRPAELEELLFLPVAELSPLVHAGAVSSEELTAAYLERLRSRGSELEAVVTLTAESAMEAARRADRELRAGLSRGPLHGIPWGAKDLLAVRGFPTTWGAMPFREQVLDLDATVVERLEAAGAVLVAKLTLGALAWGDVWFGGTTRNPWNLAQGSSGSSAGSAAATAAGLVGFAIGSETLGSIVSPSTRTGATGLRPTFGRISRHGAMTLSWTMDKLGPICRSVEDCGLVFQAILGPDGRDPSVISAPFPWPREVAPRDVRLGYVPALFEEERDDADWRRHDLATLAALRELGFRLVPIELPDLPIGPLSIILSAEAAAAFDELTRSGRDDLLVRQERYAWPNAFRQARFIPAVELIQAQRIRTLLMEAMARTMAEVDAYVTPTYAGSNLLLTNLTGHPQVVLPNGFRADGTPTSITFTGRLFDEATLLAVADRYQRATDFHLQRPPYPYRRVEEEADEVG